MVSTIIKVRGLPPTIFCSKELSFADVLKFMKNTFPDVERAEMKYVHTFGRTIKRDKYLIDVLHERFIEIN